MLEITKTKNHHGYDVFYIETDEGILQISFQGNLDLYWNYLENNKNSESHTITITKENYFLYNILDKLYDFIKSHNPYGEILSQEELQKQEIKDSYQNNPLFKDGIISWYSDETVYENASHFEIKKETDVFKITFYKSKKESLLTTTYAVRICNSGSRYNPYNILFMKMYNSLKEYNPDYHQIHIEEYLYHQKKKIRKK